MALQKQMKVSIDRADIDLIGEKCVNDSHG